ncbi:Superoxide dismutase [Cu-Zn] precursor [Pseudobythopirellula maris]|uniref:Superoxide dismutase [Cu-Zn] n=1 Tax=Pseudobythopirellula maris TaxID=2527991 RepID=A0A5C5ZJM9_9BACT|nr:superoxide dismutase family protein [Pseudobythopirellula maris]TWT87247.1 Superoxide dismutase [Cu-Zn] precursor [Pseudobythopirellula maris]
MKIMFQHGLAPALALATGCALLISLVGCAPPDADAQQVTRSATEEKSADHQHPQSVRMKIGQPMHGVAILRATDGNEVSGNLSLQDTSRGLRITGVVAGLTPGEHGFHIHQYGDLSDPAGKSAGGHFNPSGEKHGGPHDDVRHAGDFGNIKANDKGEAIVDVLAPQMKLSYVLGRSIVVHGDADDLKSQPSGAAGPRVALAVIGLAEGS